MTRGAASGQVDQMRYGAPNPARVTQRTVPGESTGGVVRRAGRRAVLEVIVADGAVVLGREMTLHTMRALGSIEAPTMRHRLRTVVAFHARVFLMAHAATLPVPRRLQAVHLPVPGRRVARRLCDAMACRTVLLFVVAIGAEHRICLRLQSVDGLPGVWGIVRNAFPVTVGRHRIQAYFPVTH